MQIVIEIDEEAYSILKTYIGHLTYSEYLIKNGVPLPKGHGALKDVDNIKTAFPSGEYVRTESVRATIDHEDTIIEADTTESEGQE